MQSPRLPVRPGLSGKTARTPYPGQCPPLSHGSHLPCLPRLVERPSQPVPSSKQGHLFALAFLALLFGLTAGWGWCFFHMPGPSAAFHLPISVQGSSTQRPASDTFTSSSGETLTRSERATPLSSTPTRESASADASQLAGHVDTGMRLSIPTLGASLPVETVGVTHYGRLDMPRLHQWDGVGLYKEGTQPGQVGSTVMDGYQRRPDGSPAAFYNLGALHVGDGVSIWRTDGVLLHFHVVSVQSYAPDQTPTSDIFDDTSGVYLNLVASASSGLPTATSAGPQIVVHTVLD